MLKKNNLKTEILKYLIIFAIIILSFLWIFQAIFFKAIYKEYKLNEIKQTANIINKNKNKITQEQINELALDKSVCIEIDNNNYELIYNSTFFGKGCIRNKEQTLKYKFDFISNNKKTQTYEIEDKRDNLNTYVYAIKLDEEQYAFINASIEPVDSIEQIIRKELLIITIIIVILSLILAEIISNIISNPIKKISKEAKKIATGNFNINFNNDSNIEEINELTTTLNYAKEELNKTEELRQDLMANISHDLKTPLTMIKAYAEMSIDLHNNNEEKRKQDVEIIKEEVERLTNLVNDILDLSKMQSKVDELNIEEFDLVELVENILKRYEVLKEKENYNFIFKHNKKETKVKADKKKIEIVIYNLINNAINYTGSDNKVTINIEDKKEIKLEIKDTGKGIKEEDIPYIWDKYYKNKKKHKRNLIGTGLGLSIVKNALELHKFKYGVETKINKGTTFYFQIPKEK